MSKKKEPDLAEQQAEVDENLTDNTAETPAEQETESVVKTEAEEWKERFLRNNAEYVNYRNRTQREKEALGEEIKLDITEKFLPVLDNLERALAVPCADEAFRQGIVMTHRQLLDLFAKLGVEEIKTEGVAFDPNLMDAVMHIDDESLGESAIAEVFQKGYILGGRVLRHAMVKVAN